MRYLAASRALMPVFSVDITTSCFFSVLYGMLNYVDTDFMKKLEARMGADFQ